LLSVQGDDVADLLHEWRWCLDGRRLTPLLLTALGDWILGAPEGSLWRLDMLEGDVVRIARDSSEFNQLKVAPDWLDDALLSGWYDIALGNGIAPDETECIGWRVHPALGGGFEASNLHTFSMRVYQSLMGQLHRQLRASSKSGS